MKKLEAQKEEIKELESELAKAKKLEEENKLKKDVESEVKKEKIKEADDVVVPLVKAKESHAVDTKKNAEFDGSFVKQNEKVETAVDEKSVIEKPRQEFKFERHNIDDEVENAAKDDEKLQDSLV